MKKIKIFSIAIMVAILCICTMQIAFAETQYHKIGGMTYEVDTVAKTASTYIYGNYNQEAGTYEYVFDATIEVPATIEVGDETYNVTKIGDYTFGAPSKVRGQTNAATSNSITTSITLPEGITEIGTYAFSYFKNSKLKIKIPSTVTIVGESAFSGSSTVTEIDFKDSSVTAIPNNCFNNCYVLQKLELPSTVESIHMNAFVNARALAEVKINSEEVNFTPANSTYGFPAAFGITPNDIPNNGSGKIPTVFYVKTDKIKTDLQALAEKKVVSTSNSITKTYDYSGINDGSQIKLFFDPITIDNITYSQYDDNGTEAIITGNTIAKGSDLAIDIPSTISVNGRTITVKAIGEKAFCYLAYNEEKKKIEPTADGKTIKSIELPETVTTINAHAFWRLNTMKTFVAKGDIVLTEEDVGIFRGCTSVAEVDFKSINMLPYNMFNTCSRLITVVIPTGESISIDIGAFDRCDPLTDVYLNAGTVTFTGDTCDADRNMKTLTMKFHVPTESAKTAFTTFGIAEDRVVTGKKLYLLDNLLGTYAVASEAMDEGKVIVAIYEKDALVDVDEIKDVDFKVGYNEIETDLEKSKTVERRIFVWNSLNNIFPLGSMIK